MTAVAILGILAASLEAQVPRLRPATPLIRSIPATPPSGLTATGTGQPVVLNWQPVPEAGVTYVPLRTQDTLTPPAPIAPPLAETTYADGAVAPGQTYYYQVSAVYPDGRSAVSSMVQFIVPAAAPAPPPAMASAGDVAQRATGAPPAGATMVGPSSSTTLTAVTPTGPPPAGFTVTGTPLVAQLKWSKALGVVSYLVFRTDGPNASPILRAKNLRALRLQDTVPDPRITYQYRLVANYSNGTWGEAVASFVSPPLVNPTGFQATITAPNTVVLDWNPTPGAVQYRVDGAGLTNTGRYVPGTTTTIAPVPPGAQSWQISALYPGNFADYANRPVATAMNRTLPAHVPAFLSKANGAGSEAETRAHYRRLIPDGADTTEPCGIIVCVLKDWGVAEAIAQNGPPGQVTYTNRTELGTTRTSVCYFGTNRSAVICHSESSRGLSLIIMNGQGARFASFGRTESYGATAWGGSYVLSTTATFDSEGPKFAPHACLACHGGRYDPTTGLVQGASLLPIDPGLVDLGADRAAAEEPIRNINAIVRQTYSTPAVAAYIQGLYGGNVDVPGTQAAANYIPQGWATQPSLYLDFVKKDCAMCHLAGPSQINFLTAGNFLSNKELIHVAVCKAHSMPHAELPFTNFWNSGSGAVFGPGLFAAALGLPGCP
jgi:hypothetical protein